ncbi:MAG: alkyl hydroperoxide reductase subunit F [Propionibacteriaceae bacterium]
MSVLDANLTNQLTQLLGNLKQPIELAASLDDSPKSVQTRDLLNEIAALSDLVTVTEEANPRTPSFAIRRTGTDIQVRFAGVPLGHEFTSLVLALLHVGGHPTKLSDAQIEAIKAIPGDHDFTTYMSLTCINCPEVVQSFNMMSVINPRIKHTAVEGGAFQSEIDDHNILAVPTVLKDGVEFGSGRMGVDDIIAKLDSGAAERTAAALSQTAPYEVLVVGGGPAGAAASVYTARKGIRTGLLVERLGGQVNDTMSIENLIGTPKTDGPTLAGKLAEHIHDYDIDVISPQTAGALAVAGADGYHEITTVSGATLKARTIILSTGASWRLMGVPGEDEYRNKGVTFCPHCDGPLFKGKSIAVIGGGNSGVEAAIDLAGVVGHVTVVEFLDEMRADKVLQDKLRSLPNVDVILGAQTTAVVGDGSKVTGLDYKIRATDEARHLDLEGVFVQIGLVPNTAWLKDSGVELSPRGEIVIDERGATNIPGIFAAGDCTTVPYKQIVISLGAGATAALGAFDHLIRTSVPQQ